MMRRPPTLEDVAARAGVSRATASRVVNGDARVHADNQRAVTAAIQALGYRPNRAARSLVVREPDSVAVIVPETDQRVFADPVIMGTLRGITDGLDSTPLQTVLVMGRLGQESARLRRWLSRGNTDAGIVMSAHLDDDIVSVLVEVGLPCVMIGRPAEDVDLPYVDVANEGGAKLATQRLVERGCRRIGTVTGPQNMTSARDRHEGWLEVVGDAGLDTDAVAFGDYTTEGGHAAMRRLIAEVPDLDGVFVASDLMAVAAVTELRAAGRRVPEDVAVVGFDDSPAALMTAPRLTTIANRSDLLGQAAAHMLGRILEGERPEPTIIDAYLVEGGTA